MPHRKIILPLALILLAVSAGSWAQSPPIVGAVIQTSHYDPQTKTMTIRILNTSRKEITAYNLSLTLTYADGTSSHGEGGPDFMNLIVNGLPGRFAAGTTHDEVTPEPKDVADIKAVLDVVIYADQTAEVQNERAFKQFVAMRQARVLAQQKVNEVINQAFADRRKDPADAAAGNGTKAACRCLERTAQHPDRQPGSVCEGRPTTKPAKKSETSLVAARPTETISSRWSRAAKTTSPR